MAERNENNRRTENNRTAAAGSRKKRFKLNINFPRFFKSGSLAVFYILLGGILFNLNDLGDLDVTLLKYKRFLPSFVVKFLPGGTAVEGKAVQDEEFQGRVIEVYDGDTAVVFNEKKNCRYKVRFYGIDAPEKDQDDGKVSRDALREKILGREVVVQVINIDTYGRSVGKVLLGGRNINMEMVVEGHAWYYRDYAKNEYTLANAEKEAQRLRRGIWRAESPEPPWEYRKRNRNRK